MPDNQLDAKAIFNLARKIEDKETRAAYLRQIGRGDTALTNRVIALLRGFENQRSFLESPVMVLSADVLSTDVEFDSHSDLIGSRIGPYELLEKIGEGGMGIVYLAVQKDPVRRKVALKVIKPGMDSQQVLDRFQAERQALAMMNHPNIARVLDVGTTESGRPYFAMELVKRIPITELCDQQKLNARERLKLLVTVCHAVQYAHQKGIIHRDIKPSNVLVEMHDVTPVPKVIDFGVAKAIGQQLSDKSVHTGLSQMIGTPLYMSPEQAGQSSVDVDTRSDVYSLGVLLYEILTGQTPFESETLKTVGFDEMRRLIREVDPPRPSARVSTLNAQALSTISDARKMEPNRLSQQLRGELDWIVMKTLEKDRSRRYESASALAADIERFLCDDPVLACPPSIAYQFQKFARRHRLVVGATLITTAALLSGIGLTMWQVMVARDAQRQAEDAKQQLAQRYRIAKESVDTYLLRITQDEQLDHPSFRQLRQRLIEAALPYYDQLHKLSPTDDLPRSARAEALNQLGRVQHELGQFNESRSAYEEAAKLFDQLAAALPSKTTYRQSLANVLVNLADHYRTRGDSGSMLAYEQHALELRKELHAKQPADDLMQMELAQSYTNVGVLIDRDKGRKLLEDAIQLWQGLSDRFPAELRYREYLSLGYHNLGHHVAWTNVEEAIPFHERAIELRSELAREQPESKKAQIHWSQSHQYLADTLAISSSQLGEALKHRQDSEQILREYAKKHPQWPEVKAHWASSKEMLARTLKEQGELDLAQESCQSALTLGEQLVSEFPGVLEYDVGLLSSQHSLGALKMAQGVPAEGLPILTEALDRLQKTLDRIGPHVQGNLLLRNIHSTLADTRKSLGQDGNRSFEDEIPAQVLQVAGEALRPSKFLTDLSYPSAHGLRAEREASSLSQTEDAEQTMKRQREKLSRSSRESANRGKRSLIVESLEERALMAVDISISDTTAIEGSDTTKLFDRFIDTGSGDLTRPRSLVFGPDANSDGTKDLYVIVSVLNSVRRYDGVTGAFIDTFIASPSLNSPYDLAFGPNGDLYISSFNGNQILQYNLSNNTLDVAVTGLSGPQGIAFGSDGSLYIANRWTNDVVRYNNSVLTVFVTANDGGLSEPNATTFGPNGNLYVGSYGTGEVLEYNGTSGEFVKALTNSVMGQGPVCWFEFGNDGYVHTTARTTPTTSNTSLNRFNATSGAYVDTLSIGRDSWSFMVGPDNIIYYSGNGGANYIERYGHSSVAAFKVSISSASDVAVTVAYSVANGTALAGTDYASTSGTITFAPGQLTQTIFVSTIDDATAEATETLTVILSNPVGATVADGVGVGTILDNDPFTKFYVVNDGTTTSTDQTFRYQATGQAIGSATGLGSGNSAPRGAASNAAGDKVWVVDANKNVFVYNSNGSPLGNWTAGSLSSTAQVEGIATNGTDVWVVDTQADRVY